MSDNIFYDETLHDECVVAMKKMVNLYVQFCSKNPNEEISGHTIRSAEEINNYLQKSDTPYYEVARVYNAFLDDIKEAECLDKFVMLPLLFLSKDTVDADSEN